MYDGGLYWVSVLVIDWRVCDIPDRPLYDCWVFALAVPGYRKPHYKKVFLANHNWCDYRGDLWNRPDVSYIVDLFSGVYSTQMDA